MESYACKFNSGLQGVLFRNNPIPMFLYDPQTLQILAANEAALARYGYAQRQIRTLTIPDLRSDATQPALQDALLIDRDHPAQSLWLHITRSGERFPVEVTVTPFRRGKRALCLMMATDVSAAVQSNPKFARFQELHRLLFQNSPFGIFRVDLTTDRLEEANPTFFQLFGYTLEEMNAGGSLQNLHLDIGDRDRLLHELRAHGSVQHFQTRYITRAGTVFHAVVFATLSPAYPQQHQFMQGYVIDITHAREIDERLAHSERIEAIGRLAGGVAHSLNNITQSISLSAELALQAGVAANVAARFKDILQQAQSAAGITQQLLAFSRRQVLQPRDVNLNTCLRAAVPVLARTVGSGIALDLQLAPTLGNVFVDPEQLTVVLTQLADNARIAMPHGGRLTLSTAPVPTVSDEDSLPDEANPPFALLTVSDNGAGMDEAVRRRIFDPFFSTKDTPLTTGLGLSTVHGIIMQSKGHIECDSRPEIGTTFRIYLPLAQPADEPLATTQTDQTHPMRLLLVEDDPLVNKHLAQSLTNAGFQVDSTADGEEALAAFQNGEFQAVVTDIVMPRLTGIELASRLRQFRPDLPIILISGYCDETSVLRDLPRHNIAYLQKPFTTAQLVSRFQQMLSNTQAARPDAR